eukprot:FR737606.1.p2 GENE.FR737606.1~~FR737606.1.p2  ORF type:complete len:100 (+),score=9.82 FR737606.1:204-503(+)
MQQLIVEDGELVTLIFPVNKKGADPAAHPNEAIGGGPPYAMSPKLVEELLVPRGFTKLTLDEVPSERQARPNMGCSEYIARWQRGNGTKGVSESIKMIQ